MICNKIKIKRMLFLLPISIWFLLCMSEWYMWIDTPNSYFFIRGHNKPNLNYETTTLGDLVYVTPANSVYITPIPRKCRIITDKYGVRNSKFYDKSDIIIIGDSFALGAGNSHEDIPAVQLSNITEKQVINFSGERNYLSNMTSYERIAYMIKFNKPIASNLFVHIIHDFELLETPYDYYPNEEIKKIVDGNFVYIEKTFIERFRDFKKNIRDFSPITIISRKIKTKILTISAKLLHKLGLYNIDDKSKLYHNGRVYGFVKIPLRSNNYTIKNKKFKQITRSLELLHFIANENNSVYLPVIIPRKAIAYNKYTSDPVRINGYGHAQVLIDWLEKRDIPFVFSHPELFAAVDEEILHGGRSVYWGDDTHWAPYGIKIVMQLVANKFQEMRVF